MCQDIKGPQDRIHLNVNMYYLFLMQNVKIIY